MVIFFKIVMSLFVLLGIINPKIVWKMSVGWMFKNAEPSEIYPTIIRISSVIFLLFLWTMV